MPTTRGRRWTEEEVQYLINKIGENPLNLKMCFLAASVYLHRSPAACASKWYSDLMKSDKREHVGIITMGKHVAIKNRKRFRNGMETTPLPTGIFLRIVNYLFDGVL